MSNHPINPQERYAALVEGMLHSDPGVTQPRKGGFGSGLRVDGKTFAMLAGDKLVVKLPRQRVDALTSSGAGEPYGHGGRVLRGWLSVDPTSEEDWLPLAREAKSFVASKR